MSKQYEYFGDKGAGVLVLAQKTGRFLVQLRSELVFEGRTYGVYGGKLEPGETCEQCAVRELREETGYTGNVVLHRIHRFKDPQANFEYQNFVGVVQDEFTPVGNWESDADYWLTFEQLKSLKPKHFGLRELIKKKKETIECLVCSPSR
eukprot:gb/GECG01015762.1/.p1 GENE.gb/GECG01015762.1/~~gb/GECG01015762.1/.p1  ORF type:complete len:149 (+),score=19.85 gb/GECG01015762.1/:1-447(+)